MSPKVQRGNSLNYKSNLSSISVIHPTLVYIGTIALWLLETRRQIRVQRGQLPARSPPIIGLRSIHRSESDVAAHKLVRELPPTLRNSPRNPNVRSASFGAVIMENQSQISPKSINAQTPKFLNSPAMQGHLNAIHWVGRARK